MGTGSTSTCQPLLNPRAQWNPSTTPFINSFEHRSCSPLSRFEYRKSDKSSTGGSDNFHRWNVNERSYDKASQRESRKNQELNQLANFCDSSCDGSTSLLLLYNRYFRSARLSSLSLSTATISCTGYTKKYLC